MEPTIAPPPSTAVTPSTINTNPDTDSYLEDTSIHNGGSTTAAAVTGGLTKLRLMCSYNGHIIPRPHDKSLCYVGGDTRIVVVDRHSTLSELTTRLTKTLLRSTSSSATTSFTVKYQLPSEDLDSLISVTTDEDLENMIDEYDRLNLNLNKSSRLRLFLFPKNPEPVSVSSIGSVLESTVKSEDWFLNALNNGTSSGFSDTSSVNCLLGLEDDVAVVVQEKKDGSDKGKSLRASCSVQDVQSVPDSPMLETTSSSFGSEDVNFVSAHVPVVSKVPIVENINRVLLEDESFLMKHQLQQKPSFGFDMAFGFDMTSPDSVSSDGSVTNPLSRRTYQDPIAQPQFSTNNNNIIRTTTDPNNINIHDQNTRIQKIQQTQQVQDSQIHPQPQFIHTAVPPPPQYLHQHPPGTVPVRVPVPSYYPMYPSQSQIRAPVLDQHNFVYYMPARPPPQGYNVPLQADPAASAPPSNQVPPPSGLFTAPRAVQTAAKTEAPAGVYRTATTTSGALPPQLVQVPSSQHQVQPSQFVGYSYIHQPSQQPGGGSGNYVYEFANPSQQGQHVYYAAAQPLPTQSAAQYQTMTSTLPVEAQADNNSVKQ